MYNKKNLSILLGFLGLVVAVLAFSLNTTKQNLNKDLSDARKSSEISTFKGVHYFKSLELKPNFELKSSFLEIINNKFLNFEKPEGKLYSKDSSFVYQANIGKLNQESQILNLLGEVRVSDDFSDYLSESLIYDGLKKVLDADGGVSGQVIDEKTLDIIKIQSQTLTSYLDKKLVNLSGDVKGRIIRKRRYEGELKFWAEKVTLNSLESRMDMSKSVKIRRNNYHLAAESAEIFLQNFNKKLKYYVLYDDVKLEEKLKLKSGKTQMRRAFAEKLEGHQSTGKIILTGAPRVEQGRDIIKGYQITLRENVELVEVDDSQSSFQLKKD